MYTIPERVAFFKQELAGFLDRGQVTAVPHVGGLHHRWMRVAA